MTWQEFAACKGSGHLFAMPIYAKRHPHVVMGPTTRIAVAQAKAICHECPVYTECDRYYTEHPDPWMIAAGKTPEERRRGQRGVA